MKTFSALALGVVVGLSAVPRSDAAAQFGRTGRSGDQVCVYKDINYQGMEECYGAGDQVNNLGAQNNSISSIRVNGRATITVYENTSFGGHSALITASVPDLGRRMMSGNTSWSDHIDSLRIGGVSASDNPNVDDRRYPGEYRRNLPQQPQDGICVFDRPNYEGRSQCFTQGQNISNLSRQNNWGGQISSILLFGRSMAVVYQDVGFRGESFTVDRDIPDLSAIRGRGNGNGNRGNGRGRGNGRNLDNWDRQISSFQVQAQRRNR